MTSSASSAGHSFILFSSLVQTLVQTELCSGVSSCGPSLRTVSSQIVALRVEGSNPFSHPSQKTMALRGDIRRREFFGERARRVGGNRSARMRGVRSRLGTRISSGPSKARRTRAKCCSPSRPTPTISRSWRPGTVAKLVKEGYTGYLLRATNDDMGDAPGLGTPGTIGDHVLGNERDNAEVARVLGLKKVFDLNYPNHRMGDVSHNELQCRLIFLIRLLKVDTVVCWDPWAHDEENPDHVQIARGIEAACWMAGRAHDYPEQFAAGLAPHTVQEKYYYARRPEVTRVVDVSGVVDQIIDCQPRQPGQGTRRAIMARGSGPNWPRRGQKLPLLGRRRRDRRPQLHQAIRPRPPP